MKLNFWLYFPSSTEKLGVMKAGHRIETRPFGHATVVSAIMLGVMKAGHRIETGIGGNVRLIVLVLGVMKAGHRIET